MMKRTLSPSTPIPTTPIPITDPPVKATSRARPRLVRAAWVVRTLALVATRIPMKPARAELNAPNTKEMPTRGEEVSLLAVKANRTATHATNTDSTLYSAFRKAIAPSAIWPAILFILSVPASCLDTQALFQITYNKPSTPRTGITYNTLCIQVRFINNSNARLH